MRAETMIIEGVNCRKSRSIYYGIAISSSLGCLTVPLVQLWLLPCWEDKVMVGSRLLPAAMFLTCAILVMRSFCVPIPTFTKETHGARGEGWLESTIAFMLLMFIISHCTQSLQFVIYTFGLCTGSLAVKQLNWPTQDVYIHHVLFIDFLCFLSGYLGYMRLIEPPFRHFVALLFVSHLVNLKLHKAGPVINFVHSPSQFRDLDA